MPFRNGIYYFRQFCIQPHMMESLKAYIEKRRPVGDFLTAVICNDLRGAVDRADDVNLQNLPAFIGYLYNEAPMGCWGSKANMEEWLGHWKDADDVENED